MYSPGSFSVALTLTILSAVFWGSWANTYKGTKKYPFALFYWDYIVGVVICSFVFAFTLGSTGGTGDAFLINLRLSDLSNIFLALIAGFIFNIANLLLVAGIDIAGLAIAFPIAIGIAVVEGVVLSYILQPKGNIAYLCIGLLLAVAAILSDAGAYKNLRDTGGTTTRKGIVVNVISGILMGGFAPFEARSLTAGHPLTPYSVAALFSLGAFICCFGINVYFMRRPLVGPRVSVGEYWTARSNDHVLGILGGIIWGLGGCFNLIAAGFVGVPISYAIGQSAPMVAALWGVLVWREFAGARTKARIFLMLMFLLYIGAVSVIALAYNS
ncbi:MAG TPA: multidrug DMT transporter permease [Bryobacteraceae bacterium]|nr:multidrug DMT transporter permease [Bryobacteraceae bacterium]